MKKNLIIPALAVMAAVSFSCSKENIEGGGSASAADGSFAPKSVIKASLSDTRTTLSDHSILWEKGDMISLFAVDGTPVEYVLSAGAGTASAKFTANETPETEMSAFAIYPATGASMVDDIAYINVNEQQNYVEDGFATYYPMAAITADGESYTFENLATVLSLPLAGDAAVKSITLETVGGEGLAGAASVDFSGAVPVLKASAEGASSSVVLTCAEPVQLSADNETVFNFVLIPGEYEGLKITVATENGGTIKYTPAFTLKPGTIKTFGGAMNVTSAANGWNLIGSFTAGWGSWIDLSESHGVAYSKNIVFPEGNEFKVRNAEGAWFGQNDAAKVYLNKRTEMFVNQANMKVAAGKYDVYCDVAWNSIFIMSAGTSPFSVIGPKGDWNNDIQMALEDGYFVAKGIEFDAGNAFKIRTTGTWDDYNIGFDAEKDITGTDQAQSVQKLDGKNMGVPTAGKYDIYFDLGATNVWVMTEGQKPF